MIDSLPARKLKTSEFYRLNEQNPNIQKIIGNRKSRTVTGLAVYSDDGRHIHLVCWSPREQTWIKHETIPRDLDVEEMAARTQAFISEHYPDDHVLNESEGVDL
jgi:hypothetical protein